MNLHKNSIVFCLMLSIFSTTAASELDFIPVGAPKLVAIYHEPFNSDLRNIVRINFLQLLDLAKVQKSTSAVIATNKNNGLKRALENNKIDKILVAARTHARSNRSTMHRLEHYFRHRNKTKGGSRSPNPKLSLSLPATCAPISAKLDSDVMKEPIVIVSSEPADMSHKPSPDVLGAFPIESSKENLEYLIGQSMAKASNAKMAVARQAVAARFAQPDHYLCPIEREQPLCLAQTLSI